MRWSKRRSVLRLDLVKSLAMWWLYLLLPLLHMPPCPEGMVPTGLGSSCVDVLPYPNWPGQGPLLGLSALPEDYLDLHGETWDAESLCAFRGKRLCTWEEWHSACRGTKRSKCPPVKSYIKPDWELIAKRDPFELFKLDQHSSPTDYPGCVGRTGMRMAGDVQEWVTYQKSYGLTGGYWSREESCGALITTHAARWASYSSGSRCCR